MHEGQCHVLDWSSRQSTCSLVIKCLGMKASESKDWFSLGEFEVDYVPPLWISAEVFYMQHDHSQFTLSQ